MPTILLVHGTGERAVSYGSTLAKVDLQARKFLGNHPVRPCLWGDPHGANLSNGHASIPTYDPSKSKKLPDEQNEQMETTCWRVLYDDPLFELRLLAYRPNTASQRELAPNEESFSGQSLHNLKMLSPRKGFLDLLSEKQLTPYWTQAYKDLAGRPELESIVKEAEREPLEVSRFLARALVARTLCLAYEEAGVSVSWATRGHMVDLLMPNLGGVPLGPLDWITKPLLGLAKWSGTLYGRRKRTALTDESYGRAGDILLYQARGEQIRGFIHDRIREAGNDVILVAHSLGGIAAVDLLIMNDLSAHVKGLVTAGSQSGYLYELDALVSLRRGKPLPDHFPKRWLNFWDPNDFLSYKTDGVFAGAPAHDVMVRSRQPFPQSHSAYWDLDEVWEEIKDYFTWKL